MTVVVGSGVKRWAGAHQPPQVLRRHGNVEVDVAGHLLSMGAPGSRHIVTTSTVPVSAQPRLMGNGVLVKAGSPVEEAGGHPVDQLDDITVTHRPRRPADHQLLPGKHT